LLTVMTSIRRPPLAVVILAAGQGTRMKSAETAKAMFGFAGRSLVGHVLAAAAPLEASHTAVVIGHRAEAVRKHLAQTAPAAAAVLQQDQRGTGHAVRLALQALPDDAQTVLVLPGDVPLLRPETLAALLDTHHAASAAATMLTSIALDPTGYGRVIRTGDGAVARVVEQRDATPEELAVTEVAAGVYAFDRCLLTDALAQVTSANQQGEEYLPDAVGILVAAGRPVHAVIADAAETAGVNDRAQLEAAHRAYNAQLVQAHQLAGVTIVDPATTWIDATVRLEPDVTLLPGVELQGQTSVAAGATVGPLATLTDTSVGARSRLSRTVTQDATIGQDCEIGPFSYLRPGARLGNHVKIGAFVEVKGSDIGDSSKVPHLSYVGDASIGEHTNIGAASVFVNYDGVAKHRTTVGNYARTGADTMFVAPVAVGDGAYTGAGTVITEDVPPGALALSRTAQQNVAGWVLRKRPGTPAARAAEAALNREAPADPVPPPSGDSPTSDDEVPPR
jgi:bifunctional UDP-N-acetylglucosamine pyrophosphorylase / glucosamine-1-phosphate N-acetyltransferase